MHVMDVVSCLLGSDLFNSFYYAFGIVLNFFGTRKLLFRVRTSIYLEFEFGLPGSENNETVRIQLASFI